MDGRKILIIGLLIGLGCFVLRLVKFNSPAKVQAEIEKQAVLDRAVLDKFMAGEPILVSKVWFVDEHGFVDQPSIDWMQRTLTKSTNVTFTAEEFEALRNAETVRIIRRKQTASH